MWPFSKKDRPLEPAGFAALFEKALRAAGEPRPIRFDAATFSLAIGDGELRVFLANHFDVWKSTSGAEREEKFARAIRTVTDYRENPDDFGLALKDLVPRVRERVFHEFPLLAIRTHSGYLPDVPHRVMARDFAVGVAIDRPDSVAAVMEDDLKAWNRTLDEALVPAIANLERRSGGAWEPLAPGAWASPWHDDHDAARVLCVDLIRALPVKGAPVAMIPNQNLLLISGADDAKGLEAIAAKAKEMLGKPRAMSGAAIVLEGRTWAPFEPPAGRPGAEALRGARLISAARDAAEQGELLKAKLEKEGRDVYVATYILFQDKRTGELRSVTSWAQGVDALLPEAEAIVFGRIKGGKPDGVRAQVAWGDARRVLGDAGMKPQGLYPERYAVSGFPTEEQFAAMGA